MATIRVAAAGVVVTVVDGQVSIEEASIGQTAAAVERGAAHFHRKTSADVGEAPGALRVNGAGRTNGAAAGSNGAAAHREPETRKHTGPSWTKAETGRLEALWPTHSAAAVARELGRNVNTVKHWARKLGLKKAVEPAVTVRPAQRQNGSGRPASRPKPSADTSAGEGDPAPVVSFTDTAAAAIETGEIPATCSKVNVANLEGETISPECEELAAVLESCELHDVPGVLAALARHDVRTVDDFAGCATDDLAGWAERKDSVLVRIPGFLDGFDLTRQQCESLVMRARLKAAWITQEEYYRHCHASARGRSQ